MIRTGFLLTMRVSASSHTPQHSNMTAKYEPPEWSSMPLYEYSLEVIKDGCIIDEIFLKNKEFFVLGRQHDLVDIPLDHPSISRRHAVLNFSKDGSLMLKDLNSAQGVVINKKPVEKDTFVRLNVGDVIRIAASTRLYVVKGPEELMPTEYDSANLEAMRKKSEDKIEQWKKQKQKNDEVTWGMREDAEDYDAEEHGNGDEDHESNMERFRKNNLPEYLKKDENYDRKYGESYSAGIDDDEAKSAKDKEILEKIRRKERKILNMQEENRRIYMKEYSQDGGLTEGQLAAVNRNDKQIAATSEEVEALVKQIRTKYKEIEKQKDVTSAGKKRSYDDSEELLDMSSQTADSSTNWRLRKKMNTTTAVASAIHKNPDSKENHDGSLSFEEIQVAIVKAEARIADLAQSIADSQKQADNMKEKLSGAITKDDLDFIIMENELVELTGKIKTQGVEQASLQERLRHLRKLSDIAKPSLLSLAKPATATGGAVIAPSLASTAPSLSNKGGADKVMLPPQSKTKSTVRMDDEDASGSAENRLESLKKAIEEDKKLEEEEQKKREKELEEEKRKRADVPVTKEPVGAMKGPARPPPSTVSMTKVAAGKDILEGGDYVWVPPKAQKGDGRTSLNDKFGY